MRILIADDDLSIRTFLAGVLKKKGYEVIETANGADAWETLRQSDAPLLAILDWIMPEMNGLEVLRRIRSVETDRPIYIIMLTIKNEKADIIAGLEAGADDYLPKPFDYGELTARVEVGRRLVYMQNKLIEARNALAHEASHDPLTGMLNRRAILDQLSKEFARFQRHGNLLCLGVLDLDHFKQINDTHGHQIGDDVLVGMSQILRKGIREYDFLGRMGGDEFLIITPMKAGTDPELMFERLLQMITENEIPTRSAKISITVSIGVACANTVSTVDQLLDSADKALYRAKEEGRNRICFDNKKIPEGESGV